VAAGLSCAWCNKKLVDEAEVFALGAKIRADYFKLADKHAGQIVPFHLFAVDREVSVVIPAAGSDAKRDGKDLLFPACSMSCGKALEAALHEDKGIAETFLK
jgi:hypothetical protein